MNITYTWQINPLDCYPEYDGETDFVFSAHWQLTGTAQDSGKTYSCTNIGVQQISITGGGTFIPFDQLTLPIVQGWVESAMGQEQVDAIKLNIAKNIENQINPPVVVKTSPWLEPKI
jgi:hypothetical protein